MHLALVDVGALASHCACCACCRAAEGNPAGALLYSAVRSYRSCDRAFARSAPFTNCPCRLPADTTNRHHDERTWARSKDKQQRPLATPRDGAVAGWGRTEAVELFVLIVVLLAGFGTVGHGIGFGEIVVRPAQLLVLVLNQLRLRNRHQHSHIS